MRDIQNEIVEKLREIERRENVRILHAVESGSRAWGFASPDSDYDVRFVYARQRDDYLRIDEPKDFIEWHLDDVLDINGWDLKKVLLQFAKGNATIFEWSGSPVVYRTTEEWKRIAGVAMRYFSEKAAVCHYYGTANNTLHEYLMKETVRYKKYFYALRPLLAAIYIERCHTAPPVLFADLLRMDIPGELRQATEELLAVKSVTTEAEELPHIPAVMDFITRETARQKGIAAAMPDDRNRDFSALNEVFREIVSA